MELEILETELLPSGECQALLVLLGLEIDIFVSLQT